MKQQGRKSDDSGVAMIVVLIVCAVVLVFCLSLLLVSYTLFAQTARQTTQFQCKILAQSCSEVLEEELKDPDSDLSAYLGEQIQNGYWLSEETDPDAGENPSKTDAVSELVLSMDDNGASGDYNVTITLTYSLNSAGDDGDDDGDDDDQDEDIKNKKLTEETYSEAVPDTKEGEQEKKSYSIKATIQCVRGDETDRDTQLYTIEMVYPSVSL